MGIKLVESNTQYISGKHHLGEDTKISGGDVMVFSIKPPSTYYYYGDKTNYDGDVCIAICSSDEYGGSVEYATDHIARLNSFPLQRSEVGYTHSCMGVDLGYNIQEMVQALLPAKEEKWRKIEEEILLNRRAREELEEVQRQTKFFNKQLEEYKREDYTDIGWNRLVTNLREIHYPKANITEIK